MFSYVISLLANLNERGRSTSELHMSDISTPQIAGGISAQQWTNGGNGPPPPSQASRAVVLPESSVINTIQQGAPTVAEVQNLITEPVIFPAQSDIVEISALV
jgi:hypothetical protein